VDALRCESERPRRSRSWCTIRREAIRFSPFNSFCLAEQGLLRFDQRSSVLALEVDRLHAKGYTDNVVDLWSGS